MRGTDIKVGQHLLKSTSPDWVHTNSWDRGHEVVVIDSRKKWSSGWYGGLVQHDVTLPDGRVITLPSDIKEATVECCKVLVQDVRALKYETADPRELRGDIVECTHDQALLDDVEWENERRNRDEYNKHEEIMKPLIDALAALGIKAGRPSWERSVIFQPVLDEDGARELTRILNDYNR